MFNKLAKVIFEGNFGVAVFIFNLLVIIFALGFGIWGVVVSYMADLSTETTTCGIGTLQSLTIAFSSLLLVMAGFGTLTWYWGRDDNAHLLGDPLQEEEMTLKDRFRKMVQYVLDVLRLFMGGISIVILIVMSVLVWKSTCFYDSPYFYAQISTFMKWEYGVHVGGQFFALLVLFISFMVKITRKVIKYKRLKKEEAEILKKTEREALGTTKFQS